MKIEGSTLRRKVRYSADAEPVFVGVCLWVQLGVKPQRFSKIPPAP